MKQTLLHQVKTLVETERKLMRDEIRRREREIEHLRQQLLSSDTTNPSVYPYISSSIFSTGPTEVARELSTCILVFVFE